MNKTYATIFLRFLLLAVLVSFPLRAHATNLLSDSFTGTVIDTTKWTVVDPTGTNVSQNGTLSINNSYHNSIFGYTSVSSKATFSNVGLSISANITKGVANDNAYLAYGTPNLTRVFAVAPSNGTVFGYVTASGVTNSVTCGSVISGALYKMTITGTGYSVYRNTGSGDVLVCTMTTAVVINNAPVVLEGGTTGTATQFDNVSVDSAIANAYTLTPTNQTGAVGALSKAFTVTPNGAYSGTITITPSGGGLSTPIVLTFNNSTIPQTFTITPTTVGTVTLTPTNSGSLTNPNPSPYIVTNGIFDFFNGTTIDTTKWAVTNPGGNDVVQNNGLFLKNGNTSGAWGTSSLVSQSLFTSNSLSMRARVTKSNVNNIAVMGYGEPNLIVTTGVSFHFALNANGADVAYVHNNTTTTPTACGSYTAGAMYRMSITGTGFSVYKDTGTGEVLQCNVTTALVLDNKSVFFESSAFSSPDQFNNVLITNATVTTPTAPLALTAVAGSGQASLSWNVPSSDGGNPIVDYLIEYKRTTDSTWTTFSDGVSTNTSASVTGLTGGTSYDFRVSAINILGSGTTATVSTTSLAGSAALTITSPLRSVAAAPTTATLTIHDENSVDFTIPYIQTSQNLTVSASVGASLVPTGGGVKFILNEGLSSQTAITSFAAPYKATFTNLAKGDYTLDAYVVDSAGAKQSGASMHDTAIHIGIGDIVAAIGNSVTECNNGYKTTTVVDNWLHAPVGTTSPDNRNFPQYGPTTVAQFGAANYCSQWEVGLSTELEAYYGYPVFIMNEGTAGYQADAIYTKMLTTQWASREAALHPNKVLLDLGTDDAATGSKTPTQFQANMQTIIGALTSTYGVSPSNIWLAKPNYYVNDTNTVKTADYLPTIDTLRSANSLAGGPDFYSFYATNTATWYDADIYQPNVAGVAQMARLWAVSMIKPRNVVSTHLGNGIRLTWDNLAAVESSINDYHISYGTSPAALTTTIDAGNTTTYDFTTLTPGQTYYFSVTGYDNSPTPQSTRASTIISDTVANAISATGYTINGPSSGTVNVPSAVFTVTPNGPYAGTVTIAPSGGGLSAPIVLTFAGNSNSQTFTITPTVAGVVTLAMSNGGSLSNPSPITYATNAIVPDVPTDVFATVGNGNATITFNPPLSNGGSPITSYTVTPTPGSVTSSSSASPIVITGLTNGIAYTFTVTATNSAGTSAASIPSNSVTPAGFTIGALSAARGNASITLNLSAALSGGSGTGYVYNVYRSLAPNFVPGPDSLLAAVPTFPYTDTTAIPGTVYYYRVIGSDSAFDTVQSTLDGITNTVGSYATPATTNTTDPTFASGIVFPNANIVYIGDSITYGALLTTGGIAPPLIAGPEIAAQSGSSIHLTNMGVPGYTTNDWSPVVPPYKSAVQASNASSAATILNNANPSYQMIFSIMLGTNDSSTDGPHRTKAAYKGNLSLIINQILTVDWPSAKIFLNYPTYLTPNTATSYVFDEDSLALLQQYDQAINELVSSYAISNPGHVILGDTYGYGYFTTRFSSQLTQETIGTNGTYYIHPNNTGAANLGNFWAVAMYNNYPQTTPIISLVSSGAPTSTGASITWATDKLASTKVNYGTTSSYGNSTAETDTSPRVVSHTAALSGLAPGTLYHYQVVSLDASGNTVTSGDQTFTTAPSAATAFTVTGPAAGFVNAISSNFTVTTNGPYTGTVTVTPSGGGLSTPIVLTFAGSTPPLTFAIMPNAPGTVTLTFSSSGALTNPLPSSYVVSTLALSSISATPSNNSAIIAWTSSNAASSQVVYGPSSSRGTITVTADINPRVTTHSLTLSGLLACTTYHYTIHSVTAASVSATSADQTFTTTGCTGNASTIATADSTVATTGGALSVNASNVSASLTVPSSYNSSALIFQLKNLDASSFFANVTDPAAVIKPMVPMVYNIKAIDTNGALVTTFTTPLSVTLQYTDSQVANLDKSSLVIERYDNGVWTPLNNCSVDTVAYTVTCTTTHFSDFAIFGTPPVVVTPPASAPSSPVISSSSGERSGGGEPDSRLVAADCPPSARFSVATGLPCAVTPAVAGTATAAAPSSAAFTLDLSLGKKSVQVQALQHYLNTHGYSVALKGNGSLGHEIVTFGAGTKAALIKFQKAHKILPATGTFGPATRAYINSHK